MSQYASDDNLARRIAIHSFGVNPIPWRDWYFAHVTVAPGSRVLDIGCGNGFMWSGHEPLIHDSSQIELADASPGMLEAARQRLAAAGPNWHFSVALVERLPYDDGSFDVAMANHMLYHATDLETAVAELARVLKTSGYLLASTNGIGHMRQLSLWMTQSQLPGADKLAEHANRFGLDNGARILSRWFRNVQMWRYEDHLSVTAVEPVLAYAESIQTLEGPELRASLRRLEVLLCEELKRHGCIRIDKETGLFRAEGPLRRSVKPRVT